MTACFELHGVVRSFGDQVVVGPLDLRIEAQSTTVLLGPSGSGKSTLLRLLNGLLEPSAGRVEFLGQAVTREQRRLRHRMGYVIQDGGLFPHMTGRQNATLLARHLGWPAERERQRIVELRELVHLSEDALERHPFDLSGGQRQRVSLMRALFLDPDVLLLDEPLAALDPMIRQSLQEDLRAIFRSLGKTVVLVTHDLAEAAYFADEVVLLREGRIAQKGAFPGLLADPADDFVRSFVQAQRSLRSVLGDEAA